MRVTVYGTRGSHPVCRRNVRRYGGNTTCLLLESGDDRVVVDGGSGIRNLGRDLSRAFPKGTRLDFFLTHPHWDHVLGLPFFKPFYSEKFEVRVHGGESEGKSVDLVLEDLHHAWRFPVSFDALAANISFDHVVSGGEIALSDLKVSALSLNHPGSSLGYRFESADGCFVILTDIAPIEGNYLGPGMAAAAAENPLAFEQAYQAALIDFIAGADLVYYDTNFTDEEIELRRDWGHSTPTDALEVLAQHASPPALILSHHDPSHSDEIMDEIYADARSRGRKLGIEVLVATEGGSFDL